MEYATTSRSALRRSLVMRTARFAVLPLPCRPPGVGDPPDSSPRRRSSSAPTRRRSQTAPPSVPPGSTRGHGLAARGRRAEGVIASYISIHGCDVVVAGSRWNRRGGAEATGGQFRNQGRGGVTPDAGLTVPLHHDGHTAHILLRPGSRSARRCIEDRRWSPPLSAPPHRGGHHHQCLILVEPGLGTAQ